MHSFKAEHNEINWTLAVEGDVARWPDYKRAFLRHCPSGQWEHRPMSAEPTVVIRLDGDGPVYRPGETLSGQYWIKPLDASQVKAIEVSVLWHTEGKGDEDMAVHEFWRRDADDDRPIDPVRTRAVQHHAAQQPLELRGRIIKVYWCVRVRAFLSRGKEVVGEKVFQLGDVPPVRVKSSS